MKIFSILIILFCSASSFAISLQDAIKTAFEKNQITKANDMRLEAARYNARGVRKDMRPSPSLGCSSSISQSSHSSSFGCSAGLSFNLYDGHAAKNRALAADIDVEALEATNNATDALIPNTKGSVANDVFNSFSNLVEFQGYIFYNQKITESLTTLLKSAKTDEQKNEIGTKLSTKKTGAIKLRNWLRNHESNYKYVVKEPVPAQLDSFEQMANSLLIPETAAEAIEIAMVKSPDIKRYRYYLESARANAKAQKAQMYSPKVSGGVNHGFSQFNGDGPSIRSSDTVAYISVSVPLGGSRQDYYRAISLELEAKELDFDRTLDEVRHAIENDLYQNLIDKVELNVSYKESVKKLESDVQDIMKKVDEGKQVDIRYALAILQEYENQTDMMIMNEKELVNYKFHIQKVIGTLFDKNTLHIE